MPLKSLSKARSLGANAIVGLRISTSAVMTRATEVLGPL